MSTAKDNRYRERLAEIGGGLKTEKARRPAMPDVASLKLDTAVDLSQLESFSATSVEIRGVAEKIKPQQQAGDLRVETDLGKLDESLDKLKRQKLDQKVQHLVEKARSLMDRADYRAALKPLGKALGITPTSAQVLLLKGYCHLNLGEYDAALDALEEARRNTQDGDTALLCLMLQGACHRARTERLEERIAELLEKARYAEALRLIDGELAANPSDPLMLYYKCGVWLAMGHEAQAKRLAQESLARVDPESAELFHRLLRNIAWRENETYLEEARAALRRSDPRAALEQLQVCQAELTGTELYDALRSYTLERTRAGRGFFSSLFSRRREAPQPIEAGVRQRLLLWLLDEEVNAGADALKRERFKEAARQFEMAQQIDAGCGLVCYLHGLSIFNGFRAAMEAEEALPDLGQVLRSLRVAEEVLRRAAVDPLMEEQSQLLLKVVLNDIGQLQEVEREIARRAEEEKPINDLIHDFNALMDKLERDRVGTTRELDNAVSRFRDIRDRAQKLRGKGPGDQAASVLRQLLTLVDQYLEQLTAARGEILVGECLDSFNRLIERLKRSPIRSQTELVNVRAELAQIQAKLDQAQREKLSREAFGLQRQLAEAIRSASRQLY